MTCPKCGSKHIRPDGSCLMCGQMVRMDEELPIRTCLSCGREERFIGSVCKDCETAIKLGAVALKKAAQRNSSSEKPPVFAKCPAEEPLGKLTEKFHRQRMAYNERHRIAAQRYVATHPEYQQKRREAAARSAARKREDPEWLAMDNARRRARHQERMATDPEYRARLAQYSKAYRERVLADPERAAKYFERQKRKRERYDTAPEGRAVQKKYRETHKAERLARHHERLANDPEYKQTYLEYGRKYYWAHHEECLERKRRDYLRKKLERENDEMEKARKEAA